MKRKFTIFAILIWVILCFFWFYTDFINRKSLDKKLENNIEFIGRIDSIKNSDNDHGFAIFYLTLLKSNTSNFNKKIDENYFPYTIKNDKAEVYAYLPLKSGDEKGNFLEIKSKQKYLSVINNKNNKVIERDIQIINDVYSKKFLRKFSKLIE